MEKKFHANLGFLLNKSARVIKADLNSRLKELELTAAQLAVLQDLFLQEQLNDGTLIVTPASIAQRLHMDRPTITGILERLRRRELIIMETLTHDRRFQRVLLTNIAKEIIPKLEEKSTETINKALENFTKVEQETLKLLLVKVINNLT